MYKLKTKLKGKIIINPFLIPIQSVNQANRLKAEFDSLGVDVEIVSNGYLLSGIKDSCVVSALKEADFIIYLDKDKYLSNLLEKCGVRLFNRHDAVRICDDKAETCICLSNHGIKIPDTVFGCLCYLADKTVQEESADKIAEQLGYPVIVKESFGSMGKGIYKVENRQELVSVMEKVKLKPHLFQKYISAKCGTDIRIIVVGGKAVACMERKNPNDFRSNIATGGTGTAIVPPQEFISVAEKCAEVIGLDYCGVDLLYGESNEPVVCEVNSNAFFDGIESATKVNVARLYAEHVIKSIK